MPPERIHYHGAAMMELCLIRHGETDWNTMARIQGRTDIPLNETGRTQAYATARMLAEEAGARAGAWDAIWASPLSRALDTAGVIADYLGMEPVHTDPDLQERDFGDAEGMSREMRIKRYGTAQIPRSESWDQVRDRGMAVMERMRHEYPRGRVLVVTHGGVINAVMGYISNGEVGPGKTMIVNASANLLVWDGEWRIEWFNRTAREVRLTIQ